MPPELKEKLVEAIVNGEVKTVEELLADWENADVLSKELADWNRETELFELNHFKFDVLSRAIDEKNAEIVKLLLYKGFDIFYKTVEGVPMSLFHACIKNFDAEIVEEFIKHGAFINQVNQNRETPLFVATKKKDMDIMKVLLNHGANVDAQSLQGTPLHQAIRGQNLDIVDFLISSGADLDDLLGKFKRSPLQEAVISKNAEIFKIILSYGALRPQGVTLLAYTVKHGTVDMVKFLLFQGMDIDSLDKDIFLMETIGTDSDEMTEFLLQHGANANYQLNKEHALHVTARFGNVKAMKKLLTYGANVDQQCKNSGKTPLHYACENGFLGVTRVLLQHHANCMILDNNNQNSLLVAVNNEHEKIVKLLMDRGKLDFTHFCMRRALKNAAANGNYKLVEMLLKGGTICDFKEAILPPIVNGHYDIVELLLRCDANASSASAWKDSALFFAVKYKNEKIVRLLLNYKADCNKSYALHQAVRNSSLEIVKLLIDHGADPNKVNGGKSTALHIARGVKMALCLINSGANFNIMDFLGRNILFIHISRQNFNFATTLLGAMIIMKHKNQAVISEDILQTVSDNLVLKEFYDQCELEIEIMKVDTFEGTDISLYDIFIASDSSKLSAYARNFNVQQYFNSKEYRLKFKNYGKMIKEHFEEALT